MPEYNECNHIGLDPKIVERFENRINRLLKDMAKHELIFFGGTVGSIRANDWVDGRQLVVGFFECYNVDGGCGAVTDSIDGLLRGE